MSKVSMDAAEFSSRTNAYITEYIKIADAKAGAALTFTVAIGAVISVLSERLLSAAQTTNPWLLLLGLIPAGVAVVSITLTLWHAVEALSPKTDPADKSLHSFPDIAEMNSHEFVDAVTRITPEEVARAYALHNHTLSRVARAKHTSVRRATNSLRVAMVATFFLAILYACAGPAKKTAQAKLAATYHSICG